MPSSAVKTRARSEEHTSELQSHDNLVCRLLLEKNNARSTSPPHPHNELPPTPPPTALTPSISGHTWRTHTACTPTPPWARLRTVFFFKKMPPPASPPPSPPPRPSRP